MAFVSYCVLDMFMNCEIRKSAFSLQDAYWEILNYKFQLKSKH